MPTDLPSPPTVGLTIRQPWANAIVYQGKRVENRSRRIPPKYIGAMVLIHAAKLAARGAVLPGGLVPAGPDTRGAVIGSARLAGCHREQDGCCAPWGERGTWHWVLEDEVIPFPEPVPALGFLGLWPPKVELVRATTAQIAAATALVEAEMLALRAINDAREAGR